MQGPKWPVLLIIIVYETLCGHWCCLGQVLYLGRAPCTKETLPDFLKWRRVTRHPLVFPGLGRHSIGYISTDTQIKINKKL